VRQENVTIDKLYKKKLLSHIIYHLQIQIIQLYYYYVYKENNMVA